MTQVYLTIDDSMSARSRELVDFLVQRNIPAILYSRGDMLDAYPGEAMYALDQGMVLANHSYAHRPSGSLSFDEWRQDFDKTEELIDGLYARCGIKRPGHYFRFPYLDRGDSDRVEQRFPALIGDVRAGRAVNLPADEKMTAIQDYLTESGFIQPFTGIEHPLYQVPAIAQACDSFMTYSSCDWMMLERHKGRDWPYKSIDDLKQAMNTDPYLFHGPGRQIVLFHDNAEITDVTIALIDHMLSNDVEFIAI